MAHMGVSKIQVVGSSSKDGSSSLAAYVNVKLRPGWREQDFVVPSLVFSLCAQMKIESAKKAACEGFLFREPVCGCFHI